MHLGAVPKKLKAALRDQTLYARELEALKKMFAQQHLAIYQTILDVALLQEALWQWSRRNASSHPELQRYERMRTEVMCLWHGWRASTDRIEAHLARAPPKVRRRIQHVIRLRDEAAPAPWWDMSWDDLVRLLVPSVVDLFHFAQGMRDEREGGTVSAESDNPAMWWKHLMTRDQKPEWLKTMMADGLEGPSSTKYTVKPAG